MNSLESALQKGSDSLLFRVSSSPPFPPFISFLLTSLHFPPAPTEPGRAADQKVWISSGVSPRRAGLGGSEEVALWSPSARPALMRGFPGSPARYPENQGPTRV